jgi:hypothetical protein
VVVGGTHGVAPAARGRDDEEAQQDRDESSRHTYFTPVQSGASHDHLAGVQENPDIRARQARRS